MAEQFLAVIDQIADVCAAPGPFLHAVSARGLRRVDLTWPGQQRSSPEPILPSADSDNIGVSRDTGPGRAGDHVGADRRADRLVGVVVAAL